MPPDLNSLPPSTTSSPQPHRGSANTTTHRHNPPSPRASNHSLAATATMNASERRTSTSTSPGSPHLDRTSSERRRSQIALNLSLNDPAVPAPGEIQRSDRRPSIEYTFSTASPANLRGTNILATGDPHHHHRQPSLGDIHNELEQEQEAQVNRMLSMIRAQQQQLDTLRAQQAAGSSTAVDDTTPQSERSFSFPSVHPAVASIPRPYGGLSRENSTSNPNRSPALRPLPGQELHPDTWPPSPGDSIRRSSSSRRNSLRDDTAYYQAEQANLQRENQMLRMRIRELEKQLAERHSSTGTTPSSHSNLVTSPPIQVEAGAGNEQS